MTSLDFSWNWNWKFTASCSGEWIRTLFSGCPGDERDSYWRWDRRFTLAFLSETFVRQRDVFMFRRPVGSTLKGYFWDWRALVCGGRFEEKYPRMKLQISYKILDSFHQFKLVEVNFSTLLPPWKTCLLDTPSAGYCRTVFFFSDPCSLWSLIVRRTCRPKMKSYCLQCTWKHSLYRAARESTSPKCTETLLTPYLTSRTNSTSSIKNSSNRHWYFKF